MMEFQQDTFAEIVESERLMVLNAAERYPAHYPHALEAVLFLSNFVKSINKDRWVSGMFLSQVKKHHLLALLSTVRLHRIQAMMDLRQVLEAGACAAFALANPGHRHFVDVDEHGILDPSQELTKQRHAWLDEKHPDGSAAIKRMKATINESMAHANIIFADTNSRFNKNDGSFDAPFFDFEDEYFVKVVLWMIGNIAVGLMDLFYGVNQGHPDVIKLVE
jgi:hypothetical protein